MKFDRCVLFRPGPVGGGHYRAAKGGQALPEAAHETSQGAGRTEEEAGEGMSLVFPTSLKGSQGMMYQSIHLFTYLFFYLFINFI